ncbi:DUF4153 domain-containing protein [Clostridium sp. Cult3]|nr:DUF4153 domain-containing protein [Clostridium sp. Cult3]
MKGDGRVNFTHRTKNILKSIKNSFKRFPITIGISTALVIMLIILLERGSYLTQDSRIVFQRINMIIALGIPLSLCIKLVYEKNQRFNKIHGISMYIFGGFILILYYYFLLKDFSMVSTVRYTGVSLFLYLAFSYIPWLGRDEGFEFYIIKVFSSFFLTIIYSLVLYLGVSAIFFTVDQLFDVNIPGKYYYYTFLVVAGVFAPSLFLARVPKIDQEFEGYEYPKSLKVLLLYIVIPLITIYSIILYIYFGKIIITKDWPRGLVSHLVLWYSVLSVAVIFFITPILKENKLANRFRSWFPKLIIPILIMMFISMGIRIKQYGITENRYFALVLGLWVIGIMIYFIFKKKLNNMVIPISLSIIALNSVFGPLSGFDVSKRSQNRRLKSLIEKNNMIGEGGLVKPTDDISMDDKLEVGMILKYFNDNHSLKDVKYLPQDFKISNMESVFGFPYMEKSLNEYSHFYYFSESRGKTLEVKGYDYLLEGYGIMGKIESNDDIAVYFNRVDLNFKIEEKGNVIYKKDLKEYGLDVLEKVKDMDLKGNNLIDQDNMTFVDENDKVKVKFIINSIDGERRNQMKDTIFNNIDYYVLIKIK